MPGRKSYGPSGKWIHDRAHKLMDRRKKESLRARYGDEKGKSIAYAIATQQAHKVGKSPKKFRTPEGMREARRKFRKPMKEYRKTAMWAGFADEMAKIAQGGSLARRMQLGGTSPSAMGSIQGLVGGGGVGGGPAPAPAPVGGGPGGPAGSALGIPGADPGSPAAGAPGGAPSASDLGIPGAANPMGGGAAAPAPSPPPPPPPAPATAAGRSAASGAAGRQMMGSLSGGFKPGASSRPSQSDLGIPD